MPAMDSRFSETAKNYSLALGNIEEVSQHDLVQNKSRSVNGLIVLGLFNQEVPRWKHCLLETERGFDSVPTHLLSETTAHRETEKNY